MASPAQENNAQGMPAKHPSSSSNSTAISTSSAATDLEKQEATGQAAEVESRDGGSIDQGVQRPVKKLLKWWQAAFYMIAYNVIIGILALPKAFSDLGLVGGIIFMVPYAAINYYTSRIVWQVTQRYGVYSYPDILALIFSRWGRWLGHTMQSLLQGFLMAVHVMAFRKVIEAINAPRIMTCGPVWTLLGATVMFLCSLSPSLKECWWIAMISCASILAATSITVVSVVSTEGNVIDRFPFLRDRLLSASSVGSGIASIVFAFTGHLAYPQIIGEMEKPSQFPRALKANAFVQGIMYLLTACIIYRFAGDAVEAPALDTTTRDLSKWAWGFAVPTVVVAGVIPALMIIKNFTRGIWFYANLPGTPWQNSWRARTIWIAFAVLIWTLAIIVAESVPSFVGIVGVAGAFLSAGISLCFPALAWFRIHRSIASRQGGSSQATEAESLGYENRQQPSGCWARFCGNARRNTREDPAIAVCNVLVFVLGVGLV